jgi:hypothetical protein
MTDMTQMVKARRDKIVRSIAKREAEIELLRGEIEKLNQLSSLASELFPPSDPVVLQNPAMPQDAPENAEPKVVKPRVQVVKAQRAVA